MEDPKKNAKIISRKKPNTFLKRFEKNIYKKSMKDFLINKFFPNI